jgi:hypothetical protein
MNLNSGNFKIGILVPSTSRNRDWENITDSYLYSIFLKSFLLTYNKEYEYVIYVGIDKDDKLLISVESQQVVQRLIGIMKNVTLKFIEIDCEPGHVTEMWNYLFTKAYNQGCDYFFQSGDDIEFLSNDWVKLSIYQLQKSRGIGVTGPVDLNNPRILTQSFVSRKHYEKLGYYFPKEIKNWYCDDWITELYISIGKLFPLGTHLCKNSGGAPRYKIVGTVSKGDPVKKLCKELVQRDIPKFK